MFVIAILLLILFLALGIGLVISGTLVQLLSEKLTTTPPKNTLGVLLLKAALIIGLTIGFTWAVLAIIPLDSVFGPIKSTPHGISRNEIIGEWKLHPLSEKPEDLDEAQTLEFNANGTGEFFFVRPRIGEAVFAEGTGNWTLEENQISIQISDESTRDGLTFFRLGVIEGDLVIWADYGDPDEGKFLIFTQ